MNVRTAEMLVRCYRAGKPTESRMDKAVRFVAGDPALQKALEEQLDFDAQMSGVIHFIKPPDDLRKKLSELSIQPRAEKTRLRKQVINPAVLTAIFGVIVIVGIVIFLGMEMAEKFPGREAVEAMVGAAGKMTGNELETEPGTMGQLSDWFYLHGYEGFEAPVELASLPVVGSRVFRQDGQIVSQVLIGSTEAPRCLIFEFHASQFGVQLSPNDDWRVLTQGEWTGAIRQHGDHCFLIVLRGAKGDMQEFLKTLPSK
jgi:hypothetical protein